MSIPFNGRSVNQLPCPTDDHKLEALRIQISDIGTCRYDHGNDDNMHDIMTLSVDYSEAQHAQDRTVSPGLLVQQTKCFSAQAS